MNTTTQPTMRLIDRLRGKYIIPVNDGAGPLNGSMVFEREFPTVPIQKEAAARIEALETALRSSLAQWKMYAELEERDLKNEKSAEGELYREMTATADAQ